MALFNQPKAFVVQTSVTTSHITCKMISKLFQPSLMSHWNFISARGNLLAIIHKIISEAYCSSGIFL